MDARQVGEIHNSNSNLEMKHDKAALLVQEMTLSSLVPAQCGNSPPI